MTGLVVVTAVVVIVSTAARPSVAVTVFVLAVATTMATAAGLVVAAAARIDAFDAVGKVDTLLAGRPPRRHRIKAGAATAAAVAEGVGSGSAAGRVAAMAARAVASLARRKRDHAWRWRPRIGARGGRVVPGAIVGTRPRTGTGTGTGTGSDGISQRGWPVVAVAATGRAGADVIRHVVAAKGARSARPQEGRHSPGAHGRVDVGYVVVLEEYDCGDKAEWRCVEAGGGFCSCVLVFLCCCKDFFRALCCAMGFFINGWDQLLFRREVKWFCRCGSRGDW